MWHNLDLFSVSNYLNQTGSTISNEKSTVGVNALQATQRLHCITTKRNETQSQKSKNKKHLLILD